MIDKLLSPSKERINTLSADLLYLEQTISLFYQSILSLGISLEQGWVFKKS